MPSAPFHPILIPLRLSATLHTSHLPRAPPSLLDSVTVTSQPLLRPHKYTQRMLIAHLIGGVVLLASFLLRMPQASSTLSLLLTAFKSVAPVSFLEQIEDVFSSPAFIDSSSFYSDVISTSPAVTDLVIYYPPSQLSNLGSATSLNVSAEVAVQEVGQKKCSPSSNWDEEKPVSTPTAYFSLFLLLASPCAVLTLYLTYVSRHRSHQLRTQLSERL